MWQVFLLFCVALGGGGGGGGGDAQLDALAFLFAISAKNNNCFLSE